MVAATGGADPSSTGLGEPTLGSEASGSLVGMNIWGTILALAWRQHGVLGVWQVEEQGMSGDVFRRRGRREGWQREVAGVWSPPGVERDRRHQLSAWSLAAGPDALVTGVDGLWLAGLQVRLPRVPRLVLPMGSHAARHLGPGLKLISSRTLRSHDAAYVQRLAVASPSRCFIDLCIPPTPPASDVRDLLVTARQARCVDLTALEGAIRQARGVPGINVLRRALSDVVEVDADSPFSDRVHRRLRRTGLRPDPAPAVVQAAGRRLHPDITFARQSVAIECDSMLAHSSQRELMVDNRKDRGYHAAGWQVLRIGHMEYDRHWDGFMADLRTTLAHAGTPAAMG